MRYSLILIFTLFCNLGFSQIKLVSSYAANPDSSILFNDIRNEIVIEGIKDPLSYYITTKGAMMSMIGKFRYLISYFNSDSVIVNVYQSKKNRSNLIYTQVFKVQNTGDPEVYFNEVKNDTFPNGQILNNSELLVKFANSNFADIFEVAHFEISLKNLEGDEILPSTFISGNKVGKEIMDKIISLKKGSLISFTQIILSSPHNGYSKYKNLNLLRN